ncbi:protein kinase [Achlya hypogyna]|uniref:Protein kinase n=1 Tax=Achlya hypogyna TaxID=1202772 RepID=A0A1V9Z450_ACHHY|nr:protein kinase [Achlya hypogyna]
MWKRCAFLLWASNGLAITNFSNESSVVWGTVLPSRLPLSVTQTTLTTDCSGVNFTSGDPDTISIHPVNWTVNFPSCIWFPDRRVARGADISAMDSRGSLKYGYLYALRSNVTVDYVKHFPPYASTIILDNLGIKELNSDLTEDHLGRRIIANRVQMVNNSITNISCVRFPDAIDVLYVPSVVNHHAGSSNMDLSYNDLSVLGDLSLSQHVTFLLLGYNRLVSLDDTKFPNSLLHFFPMYNNISSLRHAVFPPALQTLNVEGNQLTNIADVVLPSNLLDLGLSFNQITSIDGVDFPSTLDQLQLAHNNITEIHANFPASLKSLCLAGNKITAFYANTSQFELLSRLKNPNRTQLSYVRRYPPSGKWNFQGPCDIVMSTTATNTTCRNHTSTRMLWDTFPICIVPDTETHAADEPGGGYMHVVGLAAGVLLAVLLLLLASMVVRRRNVAKWYTASAETEAPPTPLHIPNDVRFDPAFFQFKVPASSVERHSVLARGGYGIVYLATIMTSRTQVAMKRVLPTRADDPIVLTDFMAEIRLSASLHHRNIVAFVGITWTTLYNVSAMYEYMPHGDLWQFLKRSPTLAWTADGGVSKQSILKDVVAALVYLHDLRPIVVHRDLKARNVLLDANYVAKLGDFGTSRACADQTMTAEIGTAVLKGIRYSEKADIYSFGVFVSEVDTGKVPYSNVKDCTPTATGVTVAMASANIAMLVVRGELHPTFSPRCPPGILDIARQCLSLDPNDRPNAAQLASWLERLSDVVYSLANNRLQSVDNVALPDTLSELDLSHNQLTTFELRIPPHLTHLSLVGNTLGALYANASQATLLERIATAADFGEVSNVSCVGHVATQVLFGTVPVCLLPDDVPTGLLVRVQGAASTTTSPSLPPVWIALICVSVLLVIAVCGCCIYRRRYLATHKQVWFCEDQPSSVLMLESRPTVGYGLLENDIRFHPSFQSCFVPPNTIVRDRVLARGGFGIVYLATIYPSHKHRHPPLRVAMKRVLPQFATELHRIEDFMLEIALCARLNHPKIVAFVGITWTTLYNVSSLTEYMPLGDVWTLLERSRHEIVLPWNVHPLAPLPFADDKHCLPRLTVSDVTEASTFTEVDPTSPVSKLSILCDMAEALVYLHCLHPSIVHRDLKTKNVLLDANYVAKVGDFGASRTFGDGDLGMTAEVGTVPWIAPEVLKGTQYNEKADIYSFGVAMSEIDLCIVPYSNIPSCTPDTHVSVSMAKSRVALLVTSGELRPSFSPSCPAAILAIARRCLAYHPDDRPSAAELSSWLLHLKP